MTADVNSVLVFKQPALNWFKIIFLSLALALFLSFAALILTGGIGAALAWSKLQPELQKRQLDLNGTLTAVKTGWNQTPMTDDAGHFNILVLGVDSLATRGDVPPLSDTMMIVSFDTKAQKISLVSLPRDLWLDGVDTKINALYAYGIQKNANKPTELVETTLSATLGMPLHRTIVVGLTQVEQLIDLVGGVKVTVPEGFIDPLFPRTDVDVRKVHDPKLLYETITFVPGEQIMSGATALKYMRSRHSAGLEGTDTARSQRQQLVIVALITQLTNFETYKTQPFLILDLWQWYNQNYAEVMPINEIVSLLRPTIEAKTLPQLLPQSLPIMKKDKISGKVLEPGVLYNPPVVKNLYLGQWVYIIPDQSAFQSTIKNLLY